MPLTLVTGPANSGKAGKVLDACRAHLDDDAVLVVPRLEDVEHARRELSGSGAVLGGRVVRFAGLIELLAGRVDPELAAFPRARGLRRELLVAEAVRRAPLRTMAESAARPGFARAAGRFLAELGRSLAEPEQLREALRLLPDSSDARAYAEDLAALFSAYRGVLSQAGCVDDELFARRALDALRRRPESAGHPAVFVYGFDDFTPIEADAIETLVRRAGASVTVSLPFEPGRVAFRAGAPAYALLSEIADEHIALAASDKHYAPRSRAALARIERQVFEERHGDPAEADLSTALAVRLAGGRRAEVELVGAEVLAALEDGVAPGEVAVVVRDPVAGALVEEVLGAYGIPVSVQRSRPLAHTALGRGLNALLRCAAGDGSAADLVAYLRTPGRVRSSQLVDRFEAEVRRREIRDAVGAREMWEERSWPLDEIDRLAAAGRGRPLLEELERRLERLFTAPRAGSAPVFTGLERADAAAVCAGRAALGEVSALEATGVIAPLDARQLAEVLGELPVELGARPSPNRVLVASPEAIRARRFDTVVVLGLNGDAFPRPASPEPFLADELGRELREAGFSVPPHRDDLDRERQLFYACASRAERRLVLSARVSDDDGVPEAPSPYLDEVRDLFSIPSIDAVTIRRALGELVWPPDVAPIALERERALAASGPRARDAPPAPLAAPAVLAELGDRCSFSAGELETFARCGVRWLVDRVVRPRALAPDSEPLRRGRLAHDVLKLTFERLRERTGSARVTPETLPVAEEILVKAVTELEPAQPVAAGTARREGERRRLEADLVRLLRRESSSAGSYEPTLFELSFGAEAGEGLPGLELEPGTCVRGRVDRVDVLGGSGRVLVRDYKAGANVAGVGAWEDEGSLQVALYMLAVAELTGRAVGGGVYVPLAGRGRPRGLVAREEAQEVPEASPSDLRSNEDLAAVLERTRARALAVAAAIRAGEVRACPERCAGGTCAYPLVCRQGAA